MSKLRFVLESTEQQVAREKRDARAAADPEIRRYMANVRPHCSCGRFARPGHDYGRDMNGEYGWTVFCKKHGEVWMS